MNSTHSYRNQANSHAIRILLRHRPAHRSFWFLRNWLLVVKKRRLSEIAGGKFVTVKASKNRKIQQLSTSGLQQVQYQSLKNSKLQQVSPSTGTDLDVGLRLVLDEKPIRLSMAILAFCAGS
jgi:hypothetical protein